MHKKGNIYSVNIGNAVNTANDKNNILILPLFIQGKLGTSRIDCGAKCRRTHVCLHSQARNRL